MKILIACEYSGIVSQAFSAKGHNVTSCDLLPSEQSIQHYQGPVEDIIEGSWDMIIAFPPCTYLCKAQMFRYKTEYGRIEKAILAVDFVKMIYYSSCPQVAIENPPGFLSQAFRPADQIINPWQFGDPYRKSTGLWLKNICPLISTIYNPIRKHVENHTNSRMSQELKSKIKSKFYPGTAQAMAQQWG